MGSKHNKRGNKKQHQKNRVKVFKEGDLVLRKIINRKNKLDERWQGPYEVLTFNEKQKGYQLKEMDGKVLKDLIPTDQLRRVAQMLEEESVSWEIDKILNHRGKVGERVYQVKWKGGFNPTWEPEEMIQTTVCIQEYWDSKKKPKGKGSSSSSSSSSSKGKGKGKRKAKKK